MTIESNLIDIHKREIYPAAITVSGGIIESIKPLEGTVLPETYILPGFTDAHIHIESSMLIPSEFARAVVRFGTVAVVSDPHEIANVCGTVGIRFMTENAAKTPLEIAFGAPSCVPATNFETSGAELTARDIDELFKTYKLKYLAEMMNDPGVLYEAPEVIAKLKIAEKYGLPIDGHAPGLVGDDLRKYSACGITTDHECFSYDEGKEKILSGMKVLIREGSAARNFEALIGLLKDFPESVMFCSDDLHPDSLSKGHINLSVKRALNYGNDLFDTLRAASLNPVMHYGLNTGLVREGDKADFIMIDNPTDFNIIRTVIGGRTVAENGISFVDHIGESPVNNFACSPKDIEEFKVLPESETIRVINAKEGELLTSLTFEKCLAIDNNAVSDTERDILKIAVVNRYNDAPPSIGFIKNFGLKRGAIASSVGHDSHNITAVGTSDKELAGAVNAVISARGGMAVCDGDETEILKLPFAGLMTDEDFEKTGSEYARIESKARALGSTLKAPFMTLSFMSLPVIPEIKLTDKGLFDSTKFEFVRLFE